MITREHIYYINLRQAYLLSPLYSDRISSRTVLFASVPDAFLDPRKIRAMYGNKVKNLWIASDCKKVTDLVEERDKVAYKLEAAEVKLIKLANTNRLKAAKKGGASNEEEVALGQHDVNGESGSAAARYVPAKKRPTHRLKPLIGKKVDTINWCRSELERLIPEVEAEQAIHRSGEAKFVNSVFVEFYTQADAQAAYQSIAHHQPLHMAPRFIGVNPEEVIWKNLRIKWYERIVRNIVTISFVCALVIFWAIPVAAVGSISNINALTDKVKFLRFINKAPTVILGLITGLLPSILLAILMALLPIILRLMAKEGGMPSLARVELRTQNFYFAFQVFQVFLVTTLSSAITASIDQIIDNPTSVTSLLASNLPLSSNFYIAFFVLQGLTISSGALLQIVGLILFKLLGKILDTTPRKMYKRFSSLAGLGWGTIVPIYTLFLVISKHYSDALYPTPCKVLTYVLGIIYCVIQPLMLGFATIGIYLIYLAYRYNLLFVFNSNIDTKGLIYPRALQQTTVGMYLCSVCMIGLFALGKAFGPLVLMIIFLVFQILYHLSLNSAVGPLLDALPISLDVEEQSLLALENGVDVQNGMNNGMDNKVPRSDTMAKNGGPPASASTTNEKTASLGPAPHKKPNLLAKWIHPEIYTDYQTLRRLVPRAFADISYTPEAERDAYYNPAIASPPPQLWIPRDVMGISRQEIAHTSKVIPISDEAAYFTEKGAIVFDTDARPPIYQEKIYY